MRRQSDTKLSKKTAYTVLFKSPGEYREKTQRWFLLQPPNSLTICMFISYPMDRHDEPGHWDGASWHRVIPFTEASPSAHGNDGLLPQQPPLLHFRTHIPPHKGEVIGHRAPLAMSRPRLLPSRGTSSEHPLGLPRWWAGCSPPATLLSV